MGSGEVQPKSDLPVKPDAPVDPAGSAAADAKKLELQRRCEDPAVQAAQKAQCSADAASDQQTLDALKADFDALNKEIYQHNLAVSGYEQQLQVYENSLAGFQAALNSYLQELAGRTFTTTALNDEADQLDAAAAKLNTQQSDLNDGYANLQTDANGENQEEADLKQGLGDLSKSISASLKALDCITCSALTALQAQTDSLLARANFTIKNPSGAPPNVPDVPRLPAPPQPPNVNVPPPPHQAAPKPPPTAGPGVVVTEYFYARASYAPRGQLAMDTPLADPQPPTVVP